jgi:hypothetical protein
MCLPFPIPPHLPDDDPIAALKSCLTYARLVLEFVINSTTYLIGASVIVLVLVGAVVRHWTDTTLPLLADAVPMLIAIVGVVMSYKQPKRENHLVTTIVLIMFGLAGTGIMSWTRVRSEKAHKMEMGNLQGKVEIVQNQNTDILEKFVGLGHAASKSATDKEAERRESILQLLRNEYILSHDNISAGILEGIEPPPIDWTNGRLGQLGETWTLEATKVTPRIPPTTPCTPGRPRINAGPDGYKGVCDEDLSQWVIDEAQTIKELAKVYVDRMGKSSKGQDGESPSSISFHFTGDYDECCAQEVKQLRVEALARIGPAAKLLKEQQQWEAMFPEERRLSTDLPPDVQAEFKRRVARDVNCYQVRDYAPYLRALGFRVKHRVVPRTPARVLHFVETNLAPPNVVLAFQIGVAIDKDLPPSEGYIVVEFSQIPASISSISRIDREVVDNQPLKAYLDAHLNAVSLEIRTPLASDKPIVAVQSFREIHVTKVTWFDE